MKPKYLPPTDSYPYMIRHRLHLLAEPRFIYEDKGEGMPAFTPGGVRKSALEGAATDRVNEVSYPYVRRLLQLKKAYKKHFTSQRLRRIDKLLELSNATCYSKLANCQLDLKKSSSQKKKRSWTDSDWKKHMDLIGPMAVPKPEFHPPPIDRGPIKPLQQMLPRIEEMSTPPEHKMYRPLSEESWYRDPVKVSRRALRYKPTERMKQLAIPKPIPAQDRTHQQTKPNHILQEVTPITL